MRSGTNNRIKKSVGLGRKKETITPCPEIMWTATQKKLLSAPLQIDLYSAIDLSEMILYHCEMSGLIS
uniref:ORF67a n=1 Tax=Pinus thunbergii TaxID=3350 RepID=Q32959_PINTH|nr:ORF67a [Pinus thunbergii]BAA04375.1 ORF67a [Pinus thunbergii]